MKTLNMEIALATWFTGSNIVVPNISWGLGIHECDLLVLTKVGYALEVEIKVSKSDLKKDVEKTHGHESNLIKALYFAIPEKLVSSIEHIPERAGIIVVEKHHNGNFCKLLRKPVINKQARKLTGEEQFTVVRLGAIRIWGLKVKIQKLTEIL